VLLMSKSEPHARLDRNQARGDESGVLHGRPIARSDRTAPTLCPTHR
jgi:hypothetical protein